MEGGVETGDLRDAGEGRHGGAAAFAVALVGVDGKEATIQRAFDRANNPPPKGERAPQKAAPAAEAKSGHNQPPEETKPERIDLRKRPTADAPLGVARAPLVADRCG